MNQYQYQYFIYKLNHLIKINQINYSKKILVSISAGQDSICLIKILELYRLHIQQNMYLEYIYIDHQWKSNSKYQIQHIINYLQCYTASKLYVYQITKKCLSETDARTLRYQIIFNHAKIHNNHVILTGHSLTDKIETFLQNLFKGTSIDGATSLSEYRLHINQLLLVRPLLNISRNYTHWLCRNLLLPIWSDQTNYYYYINRNRIRYELLPYLRSYFSLHIEKHLNSFLIISNIENEYLKQNTLKLYLFIRHHKIIGLNYKILMSQHLAIQQRVLQLFSFHHFNKQFNKTILNHIIINISKLSVTQSYKNISLKWEINKTIYINNKWLYIN